MDINTLIQIGLTKVQAKIYLFLIEHGQTTPGEIAQGIAENRTTVYSALEKLEITGLITKKENEKIFSYAPNHPSALETLAEKRLQQMSRQIRNLESALPSLINYYNEHQHTPGAITLYGEEGVQMIWDKVLSTKKTYYFLRSRFDETVNKEALEKFKQSRVALKIESENITPSEFASKISNKEIKDKFLLTRTFLPAGDYDSPVEIDIFGNNVAFINHEKNGMSTIIESPEIADAMRQFFLFAKKYIRKSTDQSDFDPKSLP